MYWRGNGPLLPAARRRGIAPLSDAPPRNTVVSEEKERHAECIYSLRFMAILRSFRNCVAYFIGLVKRSATLSSVGT